MEWNEHSQFSLVKSHFPVLTADLFFIVTQFLTVYLSSATQTHPHLSLLVMCPHLLLLDIIEFKPHSFLATCGTFWNCWTLLNMTCFSVWCWKLPNFAYFILFPFNVHHLLPLNKKLLFHGLKSSCGFCKLGYPGSSLVSLLFDEQIGGKSAIFRHTQDHIIVLHLYPDCSPITSPSYSG